MQISCVCKHCNFHFLNDNESDMCLEFDFREEEVRWVCRKCKKMNKIGFAAARKTQPLPGILAARG